MLRGGKAHAATGESMCHHLELDAEHVKTSPLRELVGNTAAEDEVGHSHNWLPKWTVKLSEVPKGARLVREGARHDRSRRGELRAPKIKELVDKSESALCSLSGQTAEKRDLPQRGIGCLILSSSFLIS